MGSRVLTAAPALRGLAPSGQHAPPLCFLSRQGSRPSAALCTPFCSRSQMCCDSRMIFPSVFASNIEADFATARAGERRRNVKANFVRMFYHFFTPLNCRRAPRQPGVVNHPCMAGPHRDSSLYRQWHEPPHRLSGRQAREDQTGTFATATGRACRGTFRALWRRTMGLARSRPQIPGLISVRCSSSASATAQISFHRCSTSSSARRQYELRVEGVVFVGHCPGGEDMSTRTPSNSKLPPRLHRDRGASLRLASGPAYRMTTRFSARSMPAPAVVEQALIGKL